MVITVAFMLLMKTSIHNDVSKPGKLLEETPHDRFKL
jgi:hypothetical protein